MKNKIVLTILGLFGAVLLIIVIGVGVFVADRMAYVKGHMEQVNQEMLDLAQQLGYTPDTLLRHQKDINDISLGPPYDAKCMNQIFFETPMTVEQFTERLNTVAPLSKGEGRKEEKSTILFDHFDFAVENSDSVAAQTFLLRRTQTKYYWHLPDSGTKISFYDTLSLPVTLVYKDHPLTGNVVEIYKNGGRFLLWIGCPIEFIEP